jgi:hypothetical protein
MGGKASHRDQGNGAECDGIEKTYVRRWKDGRNKVGWFCDRQNGDGYGPTREE